MPASHRPAPTRRHQRPWFGNVRPSAINAAMPIVSTSFPRPSATVSTGGPPPGLAWSNPDAYGRLTAWFSGGQAHGVWLC